MSISRRSSLSSRVTIGTSFGGLPARLVLTVRGHRRPQDSSKCVKGRKHEPRRSAEVIAPRKSPAARRNVYASELPGDVPRCAGTVRGAKPAQRARARGIQRASSAYSAYQKDAPTEAAIMI